MQIIIKSEIPKFINKGFVNIIKANKIAVANTLNQQAFMSRKNAIKNIQENFILRNKFTMNQIRVTKHTDMRFAIRNMESRFGATDKIDYMKLHEEGGYKKPKRGSNLSIAQLAARGGSKRKLVNKNVYLKKIQKQLVKGKLTRGFHSRRAITVARAYIAYRDNKFLIYNNNIYQITSFTKSKNRIHFKKQHIYNLSQRHARIKKNEWMKPAIQQPIRDGQNIYNSQIKKLLRQKEII